MVRFTTQQVGDVVVVDSEGRITLGQGSDALRDLIWDLVAKGYKKFVFNVGGVEYIDSSGVGVLVSGSTTVCKNGGQIKLAVLTKRVKDLLQTTKLYKDFDIHDTVEGAVKSFGIDPKLPASLSQLSCPTCHRPY